LRSIRERPAPIGEHTGARLNVAQEEAQFPTERPSGGPTGTVSAGGTLLSFTESELLMRLGDRLRALRAFRDISRRELARQSGVSERYIAQIEAGRGNVSIVLLLRISRPIRWE
jgi:DNA-binding XRE family transcriptional regulator